ncbi:TPA: archaeal proteasome endopeptidase complex subunit alpha [Candidatus Woesearchaeota archaeon]|nr:archaeal proteasome endopeptidase complex subunit alpha [Candidatus Woesearchaeota archaeon]
MQPMQHQMMGYDRAITMFSPDGRLLQVEYAKKTVSLGNTAIGMVCKDGVLLVTDKRIMDKLVVPEAIEKIWQIDDHVMATAAGILSDARILVERAQEKSAGYRITYDSPIDLLSIVKDICNLAQYCTQSGGLRPFGVSLLIAGMDSDGKKLFVTDPTGLYNQWKAVVIGEGEEDIQPILHKEYKEDLTVEQGIKIAVSGLKKFLGDQFDIERVDAAVLMDSTKNVERISREKINKLVK